MGGALFVVLYFRRASTAADSEPNDTTGHAAAITSSQHTIRTVLMVLHLLSIDHRVTPIIRGIMPSPLGVGKRPSHGIRAGGGSRFPRSGLICGATAATMPRWHDRNE